MRAAGRLAAVACIDCKRRQKLFSTQIDGHLCAIATQLDNGCIAHADPPTPAAPQGLTRLVH
jgi:hypothetical protein